MIEKKTVRHISPRALCGSTLPFDERLGDDVAPGFDTAPDIGRIEVDNFAWIDFFWSAMPFGTRRAFDREHLKQRGLHFPRI